MTYDATTKKVDETQREPEVAKLVSGLTLEFEDRGDKCSTTLYRVSDGGSYWEFKRAGTVYPLLLSSSGTDAMIALMHHVFQAHRDIPLETPVPIYPVSNPKNEEKDEHA